MPSKRAILFIDGNNFYHNLLLTGLEPGKIDFLKLSNLICEKFHSIREKTIYYNSRPIISLGEQAYYSQMKFYSSLENLPKFELKLRKLQQHSNTEARNRVQDRVDALHLCGSCKSLVEAAFVETIKRSKFKEKGIDVSIAIDMVDLAYSN